MVDRDRDFGRGDAGQGEYAQGGEYFGQGTYHGGEFGGTAYPRRGTWGFRPWGYAAGYDLGDYYGRHPQALPRGSDIPGFARTDYSPPGNWSDDDIERMIYTAVDNDDRIPHDAEIHVEANSGEVTLTGVVRSRNTKRRLDDIAWGCPGVEDVHNNIRVQSRRRSRQRQSGQANESQAGAQGG